MNIKEKILKSLDGFLLVLREKTLQTLEEVDANDGGKYWVGAGAVGELYNKLGGASFTAKSDGLYAEYKVGADTVLKKLGECKIGYTGMLGNKNGSHSYAIEIPKDTVAVIVLTTHGGSYPTAGPGAGGGMLIYDAVKKANLGHYLTCARISVSVSGTSCHINIGADHTYATFAWYIYT